MDKNRRYKKVKGGLEIIILENFKIYCSFREMDRKYK